MMGMPQLEVAEPKTKVVCVDINTFIAVPAPKGRYATGHSLI